MQTDLRLPVRNINCPVPWLLGRMAVAASGQFGSEREVVLERLHDQTHNRGFFGITGRKTLEHHVPSRLITPQITIMIPRDNNAMNPVPAELLGYPSTDILEKSRGQVKLRLLS